MENLPQEMLFIIYQQLDGMNTKYLDILRLINSSFCKSIDGFYHHKLLEFPQTLFMKYKKMVYGNECSKPGRIVVDITNINNLNNIYDEDYVLVSCNKCNIYIYEDRYSYLYCNKCKIDLTNKSII